jgi:hypothetical protein
MELWPGLVRQAVLCIASARVNFRFRIEEVAPSASLRANAHDYSSSATSIEITADYSIKYCGGQIAEYSLASRVAISAPLRAQISQLL